jgi:hypothetical protein
MRCDGPPKCRLDRDHGAMAVHIHALRIIWGSPGRAGGLPNELSERTQEPLASLGGGQGDRR